MRLLRIVGAWLVLSAGFGVAVWVAGSASGSGTPTFVADPTFNGGNPVELTFPTPAGASGTAFMGAEAVARLADGKVLVGGYDIVNTQADFGVARLNADGSLDTSFGVNGYATVDPIAGKYNLLRALAVQSDGKIVLAGSAQGGGAPELALARLNADGSLDTSFGSSGYVLDASSTSAFALAIDGTDRILVTGVGGTVRRYTASGSPDTTFNGTGVSASLMTDGLGIVLQPDGKIVIAGDKSSANAVVARFNSDGTTDTGFGANGVADVTPAGQNAALSTVTLAGSDILVGGRVGSGGGLVARLTPSGALDSTFGTGGEEVDTDGMVNALLYVPHPVLVVVYNDSDETEGDGTDDRDSQTCTQLPNGSAPVDCVPSGDSESVSGLTAAAQTVNSNGSTVDMVGSTADGHASVQQASASEPVTGTTTVTTNQTTTIDPCTQVPRPHECLYDLAVTVSLSRMVPFGNAYTSVQGVVTIVNNGPLRSPVGQTYVFGLPGAFTGREGAQVVDVTSSSSSCAPSSSRASDMNCTVPALQPGDSVDIPVEARVQAVDLEWYHVSKVTLYGHVGAPLSTNCNGLLEVTCDNNETQQSAAIAAAAAISKIKQPLKAGQLHSISGTAKAPAKAAPRSTSGTTIGIRRVQIALLRLGKSKSACDWLKSASAAFVTRKPTRGKCLPDVWLLAHGTTHWIFRFVRTLPPGKYVVYARATRSDGATDQSFSPGQHNEVTFTLK